MTAKATLGSNICLRSKSTGITIACLFRVSCTLGKRIVIIVVLVVDVVVSARVVVRSSNGCALMPNTIQQAEQVLHIISQCSGAISHLHYTNTNTNISPRRLQAKPNDAYFRCAPPSSEQLPWVFRQPEPNHRHRQQVIQVTRTCESAKGVCVNCN